MRACDCFYYKLFAINTIESAQVYTLQEKCIIQAALVIRLEKYDLNNLRN